MVALSVRRLWPCFVLAAALPLAAAQKSVVIPLVPVSSWQLVSARKLQLEDLPRFGDQIGVDKELGVTSVSARTYRRRDFNVTAIFEEAADPSSAYALYTLYTPAGSRPAPGVDLAVANSKFALMTRGRYFIRVLRPANPALSAHDLHSLLVAIGGAKLSAQNAQSLPAALPARGLEPGSEKYLLGLESSKLALPSFPGNLIGFEDGVEAKAGTYTSDGERLELLEISYPTPQLAELRFGQMVTALHINQGTGATPVFGRQKDSYALLVLNAKSRTAANHLLDRFKISQIVSEVPRYPRPDNFAVQLVELVLANGELVIFIIVFSVLGGILIYLTKRLILKVFPKSAWVRPDDDVLIRLNLT